MTIKPLLTPLLALLVAAPSLALGAGALDTSFGTSPGYTLIDVNPADTENDQAHSVIVDHAGRIVLAGFETHNTMDGNEQDMVVVRLLPDGSLDPAFGSGGIRKVAFNLGGFSDIALSVVETTDDKYVICGLAEDTDGIGGVGAFAVARLLDNGNLDTSFDLDGRVTHYVPIASPNSINLGGACDVMPDGRIVQVGSAGDSVTLTAAVAVTRLLANGAPDTSFNGTGQQVIDIGDVSTPVAYAFGVKVLDDGRILVAGAANAAPTGANLDMYALRVSGNGDLDSSFGDMGIRWITFDQGGENTDVAYGIRVLDSGSILLGGAAQTNAAGVDVAVAKLDGDGNLDAGFGTGGRALVGYDGGGDLRDVANGIASDSAGNIYLAGETRVATDNNDVGVLRLTPNGAPDAGFGTAGWTTFGIDTSSTFDSEFAYAMTLDDSGRALVAGGAALGPGLNYDLLVLRLDSDQVFHDGFEGSP